MDDNAAWTILDAIQAGGAYVSVTSSPLWADDRKWSCQISVQYRQYHGWAPERIVAIERAVTLMQQGER